MTALDRRSVLALGAVALAFPVVPGRASAAARFAPPASPVLYSRGLERTLGDGASIVVVRDFAVRFVRNGPGYRIEGNQVGVVVKAPDSLARFAQLERERVEVSVFPLEVDGSGRIVARPASRRAPQIDEAIAEALARLDGQNLDPFERDALRRLVAAVHDGAGAALAALPPDLFAPPSVPRSETREVILPDGTTGTVTVTFSGRRDPATGLMREARRDVATSYAGTSRRTSETWHLGPLE